METLHTLAELAELVETGRPLYVRWSKGPDEDIEATSCDELTGVSLPGLSANSLAVENWWADRPLITWVARRLYDYRHLAEQRGPGTRPWVLAGEEVSRGPDNEPLVRCDQPVAWIAPEVVEEAVAEVEAQPAQWGSLKRR